MSYTNYTNTLIIFDQVAKRLLEIHNDESLAEKLNNNYILLKCYYEFYNIKSEIYIDIFQKRNTPNGLLLKNLFLSQKLGFVQNKAHTKNFSSKESIEFQKMDFLMNEIIEIFKTDLDGAYGLIKIIRDIHFSDEFAKYIDFTHKIIKEKWPLLLDSMSHIFFGNITYNSKSYANLIIEANKFEKFILTKYNHKNLIKELDLLDETIKHTELHIQKNNYSYKINLLIKNNLFKDLKVMKFYQSIEKRMLDKDITINELNILKEILLKIENVFKTQLSKTNSPILKKNDELIIKKKVIVENTKTLIFNKLKKYNLNYNKSILFRDMVLSIEDSVIIEQKCYNKNIVNINVKFIKDYSDNSKEEFLKGLELIMHDLKKGQLNGTYSLEKETMKEMLNKLNILVREINLRNEIENSSKKDNKERRKI